MWKCVYPINWLVIVDWSCRWLFGRRNDKSVIFTVRKQKNLFIFIVGYTHIQGNSQPCNYLSQLNWSNRKQKVFVVHIRIINTGRFYIYFFYLLKKRNNCSCRHDLYKIFNAFIDKMFAWQMFIKWKRFCAVEIWMPNYIVRSILIYLQIVLVWLISPDESSQSMLKNPVLI